ncbi:DUF2252 domain-containing protein [Bradyrhizobium xenonodulans]|uniref:DUF2252 domain-containing protein n=1 Tax=Bradyrhizobium xenonodulans TaxID=2736875 RepID=A0ABY7MP89_9BRAD|nr:DUF2252 family protein [Bradyrhizobium xenonodulans]WBL79451.1 DUF2252 domain-containing protein [Bradyrhizobium xenonodulans]
MRFHDDNAEFEAWLRSQCRVVESDLAHKHKRMRKSAFIFLRATYFRWARRIETIHPALKAAPRVLSVGDTHTENYGTWRDLEGRLVWGVNDFDEAAIMPYPFDLVRLATSARLAQDMAVGSREAAAVILDGYRRGVMQPHPALLDEHETWMRSYVACSDQDRAKFWRDVKAYPDAKPPRHVASALKGSLPPGASLVRFASRRNGNGSLGRPRYVAIAQWCGGQIVREAKALVPSAWDWALGIKSEPRFMSLATGAYRAPDPHLALDGGFILRRIAPDSRKVDLGDRPVGRLKLDLLRAMGFDIGAIHAATKGASEKILADVGARKADWLYGAAKAAAEAVEEDFAEWRAAK